MFSHRAVRRHGFTLVELLVVIGIIAILMAILMPALTRARNQALAIKCGNQARQIYLACLMFAQDNKGQLPRPAIGPNDPPNNVDAEKKCALTMPDWGVVDYTKGAILPYLPGGPDARKDTWYCPGDLGEVTRGGGAAASGEKRNFSYSFNANVTQVENGGLRKLGIRMQEVKQSARKIYIYEEQAPNDMWCLLYDLADTNLQPHPFRGDDIPSARHAGAKYVMGNRDSTPGSANWRPYAQVGKANYCFFDGHVEILSPSDLYYHPSSFMIKVSE